MSRTRGAPRPRPLLLLAASLLLVTSCRDNSPLAPGLGAGGKTEFGTGDVRLSLSASPGPQSGELTYTLRLLAQGEDLGAYQGELRFAPGALEVVSVQGGERAEGEAQVLNLDRATGSIRFAAYALEGFAGVEVLRLVVRRRADASPKFDAWLEVIADAEGHPLTAEPGRRAAGASYMLYPNSVGPAYLGLLAGSVTSQQVVPGTKVALPVIADLTAAGSLSLARLRTRVAWDPARMTFDSVRANQALSWSFTSIISGAGSGSITFTSAGTALAATSTIATAYFTTSTGSGGTLVKVLPDSALNAQAVSVLPDLRPRALSLCLAAGSGLWGDANDDGAVNIIDAQQLARHGVGLSVLSLTAVQNRGDVNADGAVNIIDSQQVARFSVGLSASPRTNTAQFTPPTIGSITLSPTGAQSVVAGGSLQLDATALDGTGADQTGCATLTWSTTNPGVAAVNASGLVSAVAPGTATIAATSGSATATVQVTVTVIGSPALHRLANGKWHTCELDAAGAARCWGGNEYGQLGDGSFTDRDRPVAVAGGHTFTSIVANRRHTCALRNDNTAWCWGGAQYGVLGNGASSGTQNTPVQVAGGLQFSQLAVGEDHTCGLTTGGLAYCWGRNIYGELGDNTQNQRTSPGEVRGGLTFTELVAGLHHTCALRPAGAAYCWGDHRAGQLGDGSTASFRAVPTPVAGDFTWQRLSAGVYTTCGVSSDGVARCWGSNTYGSLGVIGVDRNTPVAVSGGQTFSRVYAGDTSCGLTAAGAAWCWGLNGSGQIGNGTIQNATSPSAVGGGLTFNELDTAPSGGGHTCGKTLAGAAYCWGSNSHGQLGSGVTTSRSSPVQVQFAGSFTALAAGGEVTCGTTSGTAYCWGNNTSGQLGDGTTNLNPLPGAVSGGRAFTLISTSGVHTCGAVGSTPWCWGRNNVGQVGDNTELTRLTPTALYGAPSYPQVSAGGQHSCALDATGNAWCWGDNSHGQLGDGTVIHRHSPVAVGGGYTFASISVGDQHTCARTSGGVAYCWGRNDTGAIGDNSTTNRLTPAPVAGGKSFTQLSAGSGHTCGREASGATWCWGANDTGQLGDGTTVGKLVPVQPPGTFSQVVAGAGFTCALTGAGAAHCWGSNSSGQLGGGTLTEAVVTAPQAVSGGYVFVGLAAGTYHACGYTSAGAAWCWGRNLSGQLGIPTGFGVVTAPRLVGP